MNPEKFNNPENTGREKLRQTIKDFIKKRRYPIDDSVACRNMCGEWNQQVGMELFYNHNIPCGMLWAKRKNDFLPKDHPAVENGYVYHCFVKLENEDIFIDITPRQFDAQADEIIILSKKEIDNQGWKNTEK